MKRDAFKFNLDDTESKFYDKAEACTIIPSWDCYNDEPEDWVPPKNFGCNLFEEK